MILTDNNVVEFLETAAKEYKNVVLVSFGTSLIPCSRIYDEMFLAFEMTAMENTKVIWDLPTLPEGFHPPPHIFVVSQVDRLALLSQKIASAIVTAGDFRDIDDAIMAKTPMVVMPVHGEQFGNARFVEQHNLGVSIRQDTLVAEHIVLALQELTNPLYAEGVRAFRQTALRHESFGVGVAADFILSTLDAPVTFPVEMPDLDSSHVTFMWLLLCTPSSNFISKKS